MSSDATHSGQPRASETTALRRADGADLVVAAFDYLRGLSQAGGAASGTPTVARQKESLREWARSLGLLLSPADLPAKVVLGGQEHDLFHDEATYRYFEVDPLTTHSTPLEIVKHSGGWDGYLAAIRSLERELYAEAA